MKYLLNSFYLYWATQDEMIDYFLIDDIISIAYEQIEDVTRMINSCPYSQPDVMKLQGVINKVYNELQWKRMCEKTQVFKLNYRIRSYRTNIVGRKNYWGEMIEMLYKSSPSY